MNIVGLLWTLAAFAVALGALIVVHELGHYAAARFFNVKVLRFSVGFGAVLWSRRFSRDGAEWALATFPLGGYVKMLDEREEPVAPQDLPRAFNQQSLGRRAIIVAAGPLANLVMAAVLYGLLFLTGVDEPRALLDQPPPATAAAIAGVRGGETVTAISGVAVASWPQLRWRLLQHVVDGEDFSLQALDADGVARRFDIAVDALDGKALEGDVAAVLGLRLQRWRLPAVIGVVQEDSPAAAAGLAPGDHIVAIDDEAIADWGELVRAIASGGAQQRRIEVLRDGRLLQFAITPEKTQASSGAAPVRIGVAVRTDDELHARAMINVRYGLFDSAQRAVALTWESSLLALRLMGRLVTGDMSLSNISGPVTIADYAGQSARMGGDHFLRFLAMISISIGVLNLLPVPILDGGHLMYYLAEFIKGGPLSERTMEIGQQIGLALLAVLMAVAFFNDINRLVTG